MLDRQALLSSAIGWSAKVLNATAYLTPVKRRFSIPYGPHTRHGVDLYEPLFSSSRTQTIVFFYGGGWTSGSRMTYRFVGAALALRGFRVIIPDYRLHPEASLEEIMQDATDAIAWTSQHFPNQTLFLAGHSVGAYIAVTLAANPDALPETADIKGVIGIAGPYLPMNKPQAAHLPPALLIAAENDRLVPATKTEQLALQWQESGPVKVKLYRRGGHALLIGALSPLLRWAAPVFRDFTAFTRNAQSSTRDPEESRTI
jgi:acetyl esterase/lipase